MALEAIIKMKQLNPRKQIRKTTACVEIDLGYTWRY